MPKAFAIWLWKAVGHWRYERILPGTFNRMLTMAEQSQAAQIENARAAQRLAQMDHRRAQWLGWTITLCAMACAVGCAYFGSAWIAGLFLGVPVMAVGRTLVDSARARTPPQSLRPGPALAPQAHAPADNPKP